MNSIQDFMDMENTKSKMMQLIEENNLESDVIDEEFLERVSTVVITITNAVMAQTISEEEHELIEDSIQNGTDLPLMDLVFGYMDVIILYAILTELKNIEIRELRGE